MNGKSFIILYKNFSEVLRNVKVISNFEENWTANCRIVKLLSKITPYIENAFCNNYTNGCKGFYKTIKEAEYEYSRAINRILPSVAT